MVDNDFSLARDALSFWSLLANCESHGAEIFVIPLLFSIRDNFLRYPSITLAKE
jgi:hypothetical protein